MFKEFGKRLKDSLKETGYTQARATEELKLSKNAIGNYVKGRIPEAKILYQLAHICGVSMEYLLTGKETINQYELTLEEQKLLNQYRELNEKNKAKVEGYTEVRLEEQKKSENVKGDVKSSSYQNIS